MRSIGRLAKGNKQIFHRKRCCITNQNTTIDFDSSPSAWLTHKIVRAERKEIIIPTALDYFFGQAEPVDDDVIQFFLTIGDQEKDIGYEEYQSIIAGQTLVYDSKMYEIQGTSYGFVDQGKYVDLDPDQMLRGDENNKSELQVWIGINDAAARSVKTHLMLYYDKIEIQTNFPNDNAFSDISQDEAHGCMQQQSCQQ